MEALTFIYNAMLVKRCQDFVRLISKKTANGLKIISFRIDLRKR